MLLIVNLAISIGKQSPSIAEARGSSSQPAKSFRSVATQEQNVSIVSHTFHGGPVARALVIGGQNTSVRTDSDAGKHIMDEASAINATRKHDRFCEEFCYHQYTIDNEEPTQLLRMPCKQGCLRMYSQGAFGFCECNPLEPPQDPKGGPLKQGTRGGCHTFPDPGQGWNWHASCLDLHDKDHGATADHDGFRTAAEVAEKIINACEIGWQCGLVMSGCAAADTLSPKYPRDLLKQVCQ